MVLRKVPLNAEYLSKLDEYAKPQSIEMKVESTVNQVLPGTLRTSLGLHRH